MAQEPSFLGRVDSLSFARQQDEVLKETSWPQGQIFDSLQDSLQFAKDQDRENEVREAERRREAEAREAERKRRASFTWTTTYFVDEWGERSTGGAESKQLPPVTPMGFPYNDTEAQIFVQCRPRMTWIRFTDAPNITNDETESGYSVSYLAVRLDGNTTRWRATQNWGSNDLVLPTSAINAFRAAKTFEIIIPWYGEGNVRFKWDLSGSSDMIAEACN